MGNFYQVAKYCIVKFVDWESLCNIYCKYGECMYESKKRNSVHDIVTLDPIFLQLYFLLLSRAEYRQAMMTMSSTLVETVSIDYEDFNESFLTCGTCLCK